MINESVYQDAALLYRFLSDMPPPPPVSDFILAAGSHDLRVPEHAAALYHAGLAPLIVCSGGFGKVTDGLFQEPEGVVFARRCVEMGVPENCVLVEDRATNTGENFSLSKALLAGKKLAAGLIVCKPYMAKRAWATGTRQWPEIQWSVSTPDIPFEDYAPDEEAFRRETELMVGDLQRLRVYAEKGYQAPVTVPDEVWDAFQRLADAGYDRYVIR